MILVLVHYTGNESCSSEEVIPFSYKSKDDFEIDFEIACEKALKEETSFEFFEEHSFNPYDFFIPETIVGKKSKDEKVKSFKYYSPEVYTLKEWLDKEIKIGKTKMEQMVAETDMELELLEKLSSLTKEEQTILVRFMRQEITELPSYLKEKLLEK